jgi:hypothetical protein
MWKLPWISRDHHADVVRGKDEVIAVLQAQNEALCAKLAEPAMPVAVTVKLPEDFAVIQPAFIRKKREARAGEPEKKLVDLSLIDENDERALALYAASEVGHPLDPYALTTYITRLKTQIIRAKQARRSREQQETPVGTPPAPQVVIDRINAAARGE